MTETEKHSDIASLTVKLLSAYLSNNTVASADIAGLIQSTRAALTQDVPSSETDVENPTFTAAVSTRKSLASSEHIISLIDGKPYKTLKRHLTTHGLTPETYRERYGLPASYPMVAPAFAAVRRAIAEKIGLGNRKATAAAKNDAVVEPADAAAPEAPRPSVSGSKSVSGKDAAVKNVKTPAKASASGAKQQKPPAKRMARAPKSSAKSAASASTAKTAAGVEPTDASSAPSPAAGKSRWKRPAA